MKEDITFRNPDKVYLDSCDQILYEGIEKENRTGINTISQFGHTMRFDLSKGFPLLTTKKVLWEKAFKEMLWFISGSTNINDLDERTRVIWKDWADENGSIGSGYGKQMREWTSYYPLIPKFIPQHIKNKMDNIDLFQDWESFQYAEFKSEDNNINRFIIYKVDQIKKIQWQLRNNPNDRRIVLNLWNVSELEDMKLPPCFTKNTLVKTNNGYKFINDVAYNDKLLNSKSEYENINEIFKTNYSGELFNIKTWYSAHPLELTPNHPMLTQDGFKEAKDLQKTDYLVVGINNNAVLPFIYYDINVNQYLESRRKKIFLSNIDDWYTMGYFLGDGWLERNSKKINFCIANKDINKILPKLQKSLKLCLIKNSGVNVTKFQGKIRKWEAIFLQFGHKATGKMIPKWIEDAPKEYIKAFLEGYTDADGYRGEHATHFTTVSKDIAHSLQRLYLKLGKIAKINYQIRPKTTVIEGRIVNQQNTYSIVINKKDNSNFYGYIKNNNLYIKIKHITKQYIENEYVYNFDVGNDHTYTANNYITHNCHFSSVFNVQDGKLNCLLTMRSNDIFLGNPFNITGYALLVHLFAYSCDLKVGELMISIADAHIYTNHINQIKEQMKAEIYDSPELIIKEGTPKDITQIKFEHLKLKNYKHGKLLKGKVAV